MAGLEFSVPYNYDPSTLEELFKFKNLSGNSIREVYLSGPQVYSGAGREVPEIGINEFVKVVDRVHAERIRVNLILNSTCEGGDWYSPENIGSMLEYIGQMHKEHEVEAVTIANPIFIKAIRQEHKNLDICASVLSDIDCVERAVICSDAGANVITPDVSINRNLKLLKQIKEITGTELKIMVNEGCLHKCPFRKFHFNYTSHRSKELGNVNKFLFLDHCLQVTEKDHSQVLKSGWVRPEDIGKYSEITHFFKVVDRIKPKNMIIRCVKAYLEESWDGDLLDILSANLCSFGLKHAASIDNKSLDNYKFFQKITSCDRNCYQCGYCEDLAGKLVKLGMLTREKLEDIGLKDAADKLEKLGRLA
jgi:collagenase-like PrtC family protease